MPRAPMESRVDVSAFDHLNKINLIAAAQFTESGGVLSKA